MSRTFFDRGIQLGLLIAFGGICALVLGFLWLRTENERRERPTVQGTLRKAEIIKTDRARLYVPGRRSDPLPEPIYLHDTVWALSVEYDYVVGGQMLTGQRASSSVIFDALNDYPTEPGTRLKSLLSQLQPGRQVSVHYRQGNPEDSYLLYTGNPQVQRAFISAACLMGFGLMLSGLFFTLRGS